MNTDDDTTAEFKVEGTEELDVPGEGGRSQKQAVFNWMLGTNNLWMLTPQHADKLEVVLGVALLFKVANLKIQWQSSHSPKHPALAQPRAERMRDRAFEQFEHFFKTLLSVEPRIQ